jgi:hypothetical protein
MKTKTTLKQYEVRFVHTQHSKGTVLVMAKNINDAEEMAQTAFDNGEVETNPFDGMMEVIDTQEVKKKDA